MSNGTLILNEAQQKACDNLKKFLISKKNYNFLLLGGAGSGKTTTITNIFHGSKFRIVFCSLMNKSTEVLKNSSIKFNLNFFADFMTIHKLLRLEPKYLDRENEVSFSFDKTKLEHLKMYDIVVIDECSTISQELFKYLREAQEYIEFLHGVKLKYIFLGDPNQLPSVGEDKSVVFSTATKELWPVSKLVQIMRSANDDIANINQNLLSFIPKFKNKDVDDFIKKFPYNLIPKSKGSSNKYLELDDFLDKYIETWKNVTSDVVIITYSRNNCEKNNNAIQDRIDLEAGREIPDRRDELKFYAGDRCCIDRPIEVFSIKDKKINKSTTLTSEALEEHNEAIDKTLEDTEIKPSEHKRHVMLGEYTGVTLYNGEIFDVTYAEDVLITTPLNKFKYIKKSFPAQILTICKISDITITYEIIHIDEKIIEEARSLIKKHERRMFYLNIMSEFVKKYPKLTYGYSITLYKSLGSEWNTVFVHLNSIKWSVVGSSNNAEFKKKHNLFKCVYTALSRASTNLYCYWSA